MLPVLALVVLLISAGALRDPWLRDQLGPGGLILAAASISAAAWCWVTGSRLDAVTLTLAALVQGAVWWLDMIQPRTRHAAPGRLAPRDDRTRPISFDQRVPDLRPEWAIPTAAIDTRGRHAA